MQFHYQKVGTDYATVIFTTDIFKIKKEVIDTFKKHFERIGGTCKENGKWKFPSFITSLVIAQIIHNTCFECGGLMKDGEALDNTYVSFDDFGNDAGQHGTTQSKMGHPIIKQVRKCISCGHSHT